ncbi:MAG: hypothetical protein PHG61_09735, partial [Candidatus Marinimicrobia bacterium]|nr:hypothetical protein [Candidatus Neomarinimicrobiota bacterium]
MKKALKRSVFERYYFVGIKKIDGVPDGISGNLSNISGDLSGIRGNLSGISGDLNGIRGNL